MGKQLLLFLLSFFIGFVSISVNAQVVADLHTSDVDNVICRNDPFTLYMTPSETIRYVFQFSENGGPWTDYTNLSSDAIVGNEVSQSNITLITNTQFRVKYTTDLSVNSVPNTIDPTIISVVVNQLPTVEPITYTTNTICQNASVIYSSVTPSGVWTSSNSTVASVGVSNGVVQGLSQGFSFIKYIVTDPNTGCKNQDAKIVTVNPTPIISSYSDAVCSGVTYTKIPAGVVPPGTTYNWAIPTSNAANSGDLTGMAAATTTTQSDINALLTNTTNAAITATYSITATKGSCSSVPFNLNLTVTPKPFIADRTIPICSGVGFNDQPTNQGADIIPINITYSWLAPNAIAGLSGQVASGTPTPTAFSGTLTNNTINTISINYTIKTYSDGCEGNTFTTTVSVKPKPTVTNQATTICSNTSFNIPITVGSVPANTSYTWSMPVVAGINGLQAGTNTSSISGTLSNTTNATINVDYFIRASTDGCDGSLFTLRVTVDPVPEISDQGPTQIGSGSNFNFPIGGTIVPVGTTYNWEAPSMPTGLTGGVASGTPTPTSLVGNLTNPTGGFLDALYTITPAFGSCVGSNFTYTVRVYPKPIVGLKQKTICSGETFIVTLTDGVDADVIPSGTTYGWNAPVVTGITGTVTGTAVGTISGTLTNNTNNTIVVTYLVTPFADPQYGDAFNVVVTVHPLPIVSINVTDNSGINPNDRIICSNENATFSALPVVGALTDYEYTWIVPAGVTTPSISTSSFDGNKQGTYSLGIKNILTGCNSAVLTSTSLSVNTIPTVGTISGTVNTVCVGSIIQVEAINTIGGALPYTYYGWYTSETSGMATTPNPIVNVIGQSAGGGSLRYSVLDNVGCMSDRSLPYAITVYDLPLPPIVTPVNVVYDGSAHQVNAVPANAPFGSDIIEWYDDASLGSALNPIPSITNVGSITKYAQSINNTTGCKNSSRVSASVTITRKTLNITANNKSKIYDAQQYSSGYDVTYAGFVIGENTGVLTGTLTFTGAAMTAKNVGDYGIEPSGLNASNYTLNFINGVLSITRKSISITNVSVASKVYDATDNANFITANLLGVEAADIASVQLNPVLKFPSKNIGNNLVITSTSTLIGNSTIVNNYTLNPVINATANITPKTIDASGFTTIDKVYDATNSASVTGGVFRTAIAAGTGTSNDRTPFIGDLLSLQSSGYFSNKNAANAVSIISTTTISGADANNYFLETPILTPRNITPKNLSMFGLSVAATKIYDATNSAAVLGTPQFFNAIAPGSGTAVDGFPYTGDLISFVGTPTASYNSKEVTSATTVQYAGLIIGGAQSNNYTLTMQSNSAATILQKRLTMSGLSVPASKVYDATTAATVTGMPTLQTPIAAGTGNATDGKPYLADQVDIAGTPIGQYNIQNVSATTVSFSGLYLSGSDATNYDLVIQSNATANITPKTIDASGFTTIDKVYDATNSASVTGGVFRTAIAAGTGTSNDRTPFIGDLLSLQPSGYFSNKNAANAVSIISTTTILGADANNYFLETPILTPRNITPKNLSMFGLSVAATKIYDATNSAAVLGTPQFFNAIAPGSGTAVDGFPYTGDVISFAGTLNATYNSKDVLTASSVQYNGLSIVGAQSNNYTLTMQSNSAATILQKRLTMSGLSVPASKVYDGTTAATVTGMPTLQTPIAAGTGNATDGKPYLADQVDIAGTPIGQYNIQNVSATTVSFSGLYLSGSDATNYDLVMQSNATANITPLNRKVYAEPQVKKYGTADPIFIYSHDPLIVGDVFSGVLTRIPGEAIGQYAIERGSLDLGVNYTITYFGSTLKIDPVDLYLRPNLVKRIYGDEPLDDGLESKNFTTIGLQFGETLGTIKLYFEYGLNSGNNKKDSVGIYLNKVEARNLTTGTANLTNYNIIYQLGNLQVDRYNLRIVADDKLKRETEIDPPFTYQVLNNLIAGDSLIGALTREVGVTPGFYQIQQGTLAVNNNYNYIYTPGYLNILTIKNVFVVPTAFTPNNDGLNDVLSILHNPNVAGLIYFKIFNRAGNLVYQTNALSGAWDGKVAGVMQDADAYFWISEFVTWNNLNVKQKGTFLLIK